MQKRISVRIILLSVLGLLIGITIAYYNTASLGYDNANIFTLYNDSVKIFDIVINFEDISKIISILKRIVPKVFISI
ncbi:hypothetical protein [uncultured Eubacterium sp.]|uniref:hypothetical protein n=1 Tax=uncultured Eubacterium sp. TaxID=165185 RepID=UPI0015B20C93|nr:hypothetical protein [uncultured Eubacterium sp.]